MSTSYVLKKQHAFRFVNFEVGRGRWRRERKGEGRGGGGGRGWEGKGEGRNRERKGKKDGIRRKGEEMI